MSEPSVEPLAPETIAARTVLLDALEALAPHASSFVVVGAQAVYLRTGNAGLTVAGYTTDGDLALDPTYLGDQPQLEEAMRSGGFVLCLDPAGAEKPGTWMGQTSIDGRPFDVQVDLLVPAAILPQGKSSRGARLGEPHGKRAARQARGLEAAIVDCSPMTLTGLADGDAREVEVQLAGVAALLVAKAHKLTDRLALAAAGRPDRLADKDAGDVLRLVRTTRAAEVAATLEQLRSDPVAGEATAAALEQLRTLFGSPRSPGVEMAVRAMATAVPQRTVEVQLTAYVTQLLATLA